MCIYPRSFGVLCLRAPIRLHHLHIFAKQCPQRSLLHFLNSASGAQSPSRGICDLLLSPEPGLSRNSPELGTQGQKSSSGLNLDWNVGIHVSQSSPKPRNHLGKVLLPFSRPELPAWWCDTGNVRSPQDPAKCGFVSLIHKGVFWGREEL